MNKKRISDRGQHIKTILKDFINRYNDYPDYQKYFKAQFSLHHIKKYYAICQIFAINALILTENDNDGSGVLESAFLIMFPIQLSTFLMTLVRKSRISNISWHIFYALSLLSPFLITINSNVKNQLEVAKIFLPILYIILRLEYNMNKYYLMSHVFILNMYIQYRNGSIILPYIS